VPRIELNSRERIIVDLLAKGHTDASVSRQLGLSQRTVAYTVRGLMDRLGVDNRFQLGLALSLIQDSTKDSDGGRNHDVGGCGGP
jgi:DNA-binding NarL/FixJ family response regulator